MVGRSEFKSKLNRDLIDDLKSSNLKADFLYTFDIRHKRYFIRHIDPVTDTVSYFKYMTDEHVLRFTNICAYSSIDIARRDLYYFSKFDGIKDLCLGIVNSKNELIGTIGYNLTSLSGTYLSYNNKSYSNDQFSRKDNASNYIYEVVGDLDFKYWGLGIMRYAGLFLIDYARSFGINKLYAKVLIENKRATNLLNRFGCSIINMVKQNNKQCYLFCLPLRK